MNLLRSLWRVSRGWILIVFAAVVSLVLGYIGFVEHAELKGYNRSVLDVLYLDWQLFTMESGGVEGPVPWQLEVARILAPLTAASAVFRIFVEFLRNRWRGLKLALARNHVIICGLGRRGLQLAEECRRQGHGVVVIESNSHAGGLPVARDAGILLVTGDATHQAILRSAHVERARSLIAVCGNDGVNIEIALRSKEILDEVDSHVHGRRLCCLVQVMDFTFATMFKDHPLLRETGKRFSVSIFNSYENSARLLLRDHPLDREFIGPDDPRQIRLVLFGLGQMGESLLIQAAKICHVANGKRLTVTIVDHSAEVRRRGLYVRYPQLDNVCDVEFVHAECDDSLTLRRVAEIARDPAVMCSIAICFDNDSRNAQYALSVRRHVERDSVPVYVRINQESGLASLFAPSTNGENMYCFGSTYSSCSWEMVEGDGLDNLARMIHEDYVAKQRGRGVKSSPSTEDWDHLSPELRDSNRQQADHIPVKLRALGYPVRRIAELKEAPEIPADLVETLARMEHARWNAERYLAGWTLGEKDVKRRRSPYLVPYDELPDEIKGYDVDAVMNIPRLLAIARQETCDR